MSAFHHLLAQAFLAATVADDPGKGQHHPTGLERTPGAAIAALVLPW